MNAARREEIQRTYVRVCGDSNFKMSPAMAAQFTGRLLFDSPTDGALAVWIALGLDNMEAIAAGTHPCLLMPRYADEWTISRAKARQAA